jgi:hypothetical protein
MLGFGTRPLGGMFIQSYYPPNAASQRRFLFKPSSAKQRCLRSLTPALTGVNYLSGGRTMDIDALLSHHQIVTDQAGNKTAVLVDLPTWEKIVAALEALEDLALNRAMDEAADSPALPRAEALAFLAAED